jgi:hypothetical protein
VDANDGTAKALIADPRIVVSPGGTRNTAPSRRGIGSLCAHSCRSRVGQVLAAGLTVLPLAPVSRVERAKVPDGLVAISGCWLHLESVPGGL